MPRETINGEFTYRLPAANWFTAGDEPSQGGAGQTSTPSLAIVIHPWGCQRQRGGWHLGSTNQRVPGPTSSARQCHSSIVAERVMLCHQGEGKLSPSNCPSSSRAL